MQRILGTLLAFLLLSSSPHSPAQSVGERGKQREAGAAEASTPESLPSETRRLSLEQIGGQTTFSLRSTESSTSMTFGGRYDEVVTAAALTLRYTHSPSLIPGQSHIKVLINDEMVGVAPISGENPGQVAVHRIVIDPRVIGDFNRLKLQSVAHYAQECEDPLSSALWIDVSGSSELELVVRPVVLESDLALLPEPFFDKRDLTRLNLQFVLPPRPSRATLQAAAITASWFGQLAAWRGARFLAHLDRLPRGHAVVLADNDNRPAFLAQQPLAEGPTLSLITNPADGFSKLLLVLGRDGRDLQVAAQALVLGSAAVSGKTVRIHDVKVEAARRPYDAPNWVRPDRPTKLGELIDSPDELQAIGHAPDFIRVKLRIPPDLFTWRSKGVPIDVKYRYTACPAGAAKLDVAVNDELVSSFQLKPSGASDGAARVRLALLEDGLLGDGNRVLIPAFKLGSRNEMQFGFSFAIKRQEGCGGTHLDHVRAMIDADSQVDFSGFSHYAALPHLGYFATSGFPFTKYADLSQTVVVVPEAPAPAEIEALLTLMGRMGASTGYPAARVRLAGPRDAALLRDADLLVVGTWPGQALLSEWSEHLPAAISGPQRTIRLPARDANALFDWLGFGTPPDATVAARVSVEGNGPLAALLAFESPVTAKRSVVAVTAVAPEHLRHTLDALDNPGRVRAMHGSVVFVHPQKVESHLTGRIYYVGALPVWTVAWFHLSGHPFLAATTTLLAVSMLVFTLKRALERVRVQRIRGQR
jgi:hypothetical protein